MASRSRCSLALVGILGLAPLAAATGQISPGPLARAHRELEGARSCTKCHGPKREALSAGCLSCHREVAWLMQRQRGYHAREAGAGKKSCESCHPDHAGADFSLISWPGGSPERFDHRQAGWVLEQRHADVTCEKCHSEANRVSEAARLSRRSAGTGWVGLETSCWSCHQGDDAHKGALDQRCESCHDASGWDRAPKFDHARTDYPLTGKHATVSCDGCHATERLSPRRDAKGERIPVYSPVPFASCADCHADPHRGAMQATCAQCHSTRTFEVERGRGFDHAKTRYPLLGRHRVAECAACHGEKLAKARPPSATCGSCHQDPHAGAATLRGGSADCGACHDVDGFRPSTYTAQRHAQAAFALEGKHRETACSGCHAAVPDARARHDSAGFVFRIGARACAECHEDAHRPGPSVRVAASRCEACHAAAGWTPSTFTVAQHGGLRLPLDGRHATTACSSCHAASRPAGGESAPKTNGGPRGRVAAAPAAVTRSPARLPATVALALPSADCGACHVDAHQGRYRDRALGSDAGCRTCHEPSRFRPSTMDLALHARFGLALEGAHRAAACVDCHAELRRPEARRTLLANPEGVTPFPAPAAAPTRTPTPAPTPAPTTAVRGCAACHENPHGTQFDSRPGGASCDRCHGVAAFVPASTFDHERHAAFSLQGAHARVACAACHPAVRDGDTTIARYRPLSSKCESCHVPRLPGGVS